MVDELRDFSGHAFGARLSESLKWFLVDGSDLIQHLEHRDIRGVLYVGRRVEHAWQHLEHFARNWIDADETESEDWAFEIAGLTRSRARLPAIPPQAATAEEWARCAHDAFKIAGNAVDSLRPEGTVVRVQLRLAREAYSLFRLAKYKWTELALDAMEVAEVAYQVLDG